MARIFEDITQTIGNTPLIRVNSLYPALRLVVIVIAAGLHLWWIVGR